jgi:tRNA pseudouridine13 synthase
MSEASPHAELRGRSRPPFPRLTTDLPGSGGRLTSSPEDFQVEEVLAYPLEGHGEHLFVRVQKSGIDTLEVTRRLVRQFGLATDGARLPAEVGLGGLKDRHAIARQWLSLPARWFDEPALERLATLADEHFSVLEIRRHAHKLRRGHVRANRFTLVIRDVPEGGLTRARRVLARLGELGVPNTFGPQRFGAAGDNADVAREILAGQRRAPRERRLAELYFSALQSEVFNRALAMRLERGLWLTALEGDLMRKHDSGGIFEVRDPGAETPRLVAREISPTAAMPGRRTRWAKGEALAMERAAMAASGLDERAAARLGEGTRRALRFPLDPEARLTEAGPGAFRLEVTLPSGAYATVLLDELLKPEGGPLTRSAALDAGADEDADAPDPAD